MFIQAVCTSLLLGEEPRGKEMVIPSSELLAAGIDHGHTPSFIQKSERQFEKFYPLPIESYR